MSRYIGARNASAGASAERLDMTVRMIMVEVCHWISKTQTDKYKGNARGSLFLDTWRSSCKSDQRWIGRQRARRAFITLPCYIRSRRHHQYVEMKMSNSSCTKVHTLERGRKRATNPLAGRYLPSANLLWPWHVQCQWIDVMFRSGTARYLGSLGWVESLLASKTGVEQSVLW